MNPIQGRPEQERSRCSTAVLGGGVTGLAAAAVLQDRGVDYVLLEKEDVPGGYARSFDLDGFTFDWSGHLMQANQEETRRILQSKCKDLFAEHRRRAEIRLGPSGGTRVPYPFQANLRFLGRKEAEKCLKAFEHAAAKNLGRQPAKTFPAFVRNTFGPAMAESFFLPYNRKLFARRLEGITTEWTEWSVPRPSPDEIRLGALGVQKKAYGYNAVFFYPDKGSIQLLPMALAKGLTSLRTGAEVREIDLKTMAIRLADGGVVSYDRLISTVPLNRLVSMLRPRPVEARRWSRALTSAKTLVVNLGVEGPAPTDRHWMYFPDPGLTFFRVGVYTNFAAHMAPKGCHSFYVEIGIRGKRDLEEVAEQAKADMKKVGLLKSASSVLVEQHLLMDPAYVDYTRARARAVREIASFLERHSVYLAGRYGRWEYGSMDTSMAQGVMAAAMAADTQGQ